MFSCKCLEISSVLIILIKKKTFSVSKNTVCNALGKGNYCVDEFCGKAEAFKMCTPVCVGEQCSSP